MGKALYAIDFLAFFLEKLKIDQENRRKFLKETEEVFWWHQIERLVTSLDETQLDEFMVFVEENRGEPRKVFKKLFSYFTREEIQAMVKEDNRRLALVFYQALDDFLKKQA
jgi:hypothetical protein